MEYLNKDSLIGIWNHDGGPGGQIFYEAALVILPSSRGIYWPNTWGDEDPIEFTIKMSEDNVRFTPIDKDSFVSYHQTDPLLTQNLTFFIESVENKDTQSHRQSESIQLKLSRNTRKNNWESVFRKATGFINDIPKL